MTLCFRTEIKQKLKDIQRKSYEQKTLKRKPLFKPKENSPSKQRTSFYDAPSIHDNNKKSTPKSENRVFQQTKFTPPCGESFYEDDAMMISSTLVNFKERNRTSHQPSELENTQENYPGKLKFKSTSTPSNNTSLTLKKEPDSFNLSFTGANSDNPKKREHKVDFVSNPDCLPIKLDKLQETFSTYEDDSSHSRFERDMFHSREDKKPECPSNKSMTEHGEFTAWNSTMSSPGNLFSLQI